MNRYDIKNLASGIITHSYTGEIAQDAQPEWGMKERIIPTDSCTQAEIASAIETIQGIDGLEYKKLPGSYEIIVTDITSDLADKKVKHDARRTRLKDLATITNIAQVKAIIKDLIDELGLS